MKTPDPEFDSMVNVWNAYNALITYAWSRSASLIYNGERDGLGYRDTVQDFLGVTPLLKQDMRARLELMLTGQVESGGAMPLVRPFDHEPNKEQPPRKEDFPERRRALAVSRRARLRRGDGRARLLHKELPYADRGSATVLGHLRRALEFNLERTGRERAALGPRRRLERLLQARLHGRERHGGLPGLLRPECLPRHCGTLRARAEKRPGPRPSEPSWSG